MGLKDYFAREPVRLGVPVISVGNMTMGGTGKTPVTAAVAQLLREAGRQPAIVSRGYGRKSKVSEVVVVSSPEKVLATTAEGGDEPCLLARRLPGVAVAVCADRAAAARDIIGRGWCDCIVLDDGFQHRRLARDLDIVLLDATVDVRRQWLQPFGRLREPLGGLRRASVIVHTRVPADCAVLPPLLVRNEALVTARAPGVPQQRAVFRHDGWHRAAGPEGAHPAAGERVLAFCGIARPRQFFDDLRRGGLAVAETRAFRDHAPYTVPALARVLKTAERARCTSLVCTEKDAVKLSELGWEPPLPVWFPRLDVAFADSAAMAEILASVLRLPAPGPVNS